MNLGFYRQQFRDQLHVRKDDGPLWLFWMVVLPIVPLLAYMCLGFLKIMPSIDGVSRHLYIIVGVTSWLLFADLVQQPYRSVMKYRGYFIRQEVSLTHLLTAWLPERLFAAALQYAFCLIFVSFSVTLIVESIGFYLVLNALGFLVFSAFGVLVGVTGLIAPGLLNLVDTSVRFLLFLSAVIFPLPSGEIIDIVKVANPFYVFVDGSRNALLGLPIDWVPILGWSAGAAVILLFLKGRLASITPDVRDYLA